jgi:hypothetical protein
MKNLMFPIVTVLLLAVPALSQVGGGYDLTWNTFDGGGYMWSTGGGYSVGGTIGQPEGSVVALTGGGFELIGGFWAGVGPACTSFVRPDFDQDCDVDAGDLQLFETCASGPGIPQNGSPICLVADLDRDGDVDQSDFAVFQRCYGSENVPASPNCGN